jgi:tungstate transport system substrate-binding protein
MINRTLARAVLPILLSSLIGAALSTVDANADEPKSLLLATTTSVQDSGLLGALLPDFTRRTGIRVRTVAVGTGAALRMGRDGNADVLLTHAAAAEQKLLDSGALDRRVEIMENYFVLAGPSTDPAKVGDAANVLAALESIREIGAPYVSRADDSGTNKKELALFARAGISADVGWPALTRTGSGMGLSLQVAGQRQAYILSDIGTFLAFREQTGLMALSHPEPDLRNVYSILRVSRKMHPRVRADETDQLIAFFQQDETRAHISKFGVEEFGRPLFTALSSSKDP